MTKQLASLVLWIGLSVWTVHGQATPLRLDYSVTPLSGGLFDYNFTLTLDNHDSSWLSGQNFNWIIFGDCAGPCTSPLTNFIGDNTDLPIGPFTAYSTSAGGHNGPTLLQFITNFQNEGWIPNVVGESLTWSGTSTADLSQGSLRWSNLAGSGTRANFEIANRLDNRVPEPATLLLIASGVFGLFIREGERRNRKLT